MDPSPDDDSLIAESPPRRWSLFRKIVVGSLCVFVLGLGVIVYGLRYGFTPLPPPVTGLPPMVEWNTIPPTHAWYPVRELIHKTAGLIDEKQEAEESFKLSKLLILWGDYGQVGLTNLAQALEEAGRDLEAEEVLDRILGAKDHGLVYWHKAPEGIQSRRDEIVSRMRDMARLRIIQAYATGSVAEINRRIVEFVDLNCRLDWYLGGWKLAIREVIRLLNLGTSQDLKSLREAWSPLLRDESNVILGEDTWLFVELIQRSHSQVRKGPTSLKEFREGYGGLVRGMLGIDQNHSETMWYELPADFGFALCGYGLVKLSRFEDFEKLEATVETWVRRDAVKPFSAWMRGGEAPRKSRLEPLDTRFLYDRPLIHFLIQHLEQYEVPMLRDRLKRFAFSKLEIDVRLALEGFRRTEGRVPHSLDELQKSEFPLLTGDLAELLQLNYQPLTNSWICWSGGESTPGAGAELLKNAWLKASEFKSRPWWVFTSEDARLEREWANLKLAEAEKRRKEGFREFMDPELAAKYGLSLPKPPSTPQPQPATNTPAVPAKP